MAGNGAKTRVSICTPEEFGLLYALFLALNDVDTHVKQHGKNGQFKTLWRRMTERFNTVQTFYMAE